MDKSTACFSATFSEDVANGKETVANHSSKGTYQEKYEIDDIGFSFVKKCIEVIESQGLEDEGLYRLVGVNSKVNKLTQIALDKHKIEKINLKDTNEWEIKTITSALKNYFRNLAEPLLTFKLHSAFITAAKQDNKLQKIADIHALVYQLPRRNFKMLELLVKHLCRVAKHSDKNLMTISNLGVCFGPTLLRQPEQNVAAMLDIKFGNIVVEFLIEYCDKIFGTVPLEQDNKRPLPSYASSSVNHCHSAVFSGELTAQVERIEKEPYCYEDAERISNSIGNKMMISHHNLRTSMSGTLMEESSNSNAIPQKHYIGNVHSQSLFHPDQPRSYAYKDYQKETGDGQYGSLHSHRYPASVKKKPLSVYNPTFQDNLHYNNSTDSNSSRLSPSSTSVVPSVSHHSPYATPKTSPRGKQITNINYESDCLSTVGDSIRSADYRHENRKGPDDFHPTKYGHFSGYRNCLDIDRTKRTIQSQTDLPPPSISTGRRVRTLYSCIGENESELCFEPNQVIYHVRPSKEPGWLEGYLNGHIGLVPENYVEYLP
ncbi:rho GTPase-activating protein 26-like [Centruroides vittatus]|uniref:rho GTPase-activating protein 26-like n=1 Tax=Centruroides vittatus TaxID=120091 RepID=UPI00350FAAF6